METEQEQKPSLLRRIFTIIIGIFLLSLVLSYFIFDESTRLTILGFLTSSKLNNNTLTVDKTTNLIFNNASLSTLNHLYDSNLEVEFKACLKGEKISNTYFIAETIQPRTFQQEYNFVIAESCPKGTLVDLHTHPFNQCIPSEIDVKNFRKFQKQNPDALLAVMCEKDRFYFYR